MASDKLVSEIYVVKQWEFEAAKHLACILGSLGAGRAQWSWENNKTIDTAWTRDRHIFQISGHKDKAKRNYVIFNNHYYLDDSGVKYGKPHTISSDKEEVQGSAQTYDNSLYDSDSNQTFTREVEVASVVSHTMDETHETSIKSSTKITGKYSGVEFEQQIEAAYGFTLNKSQTEEESKVERQTVADTFKVKAGAIVVASVEKEKLIIETPYTVNAIFDCGLFMDIENWAGVGVLLWGGRKHANAFEFDNLLEFERFLKGYDVRYPQMSKYEPNADAQKSMAWLFDNNKRLVSAPGVKRRVYDDHVKIRKVTTKKGG